MWLIPAIGIEGTFVGYRHTCDYACRNEISHEGVSARVAANAVPLTKGREQRPLGGCRRA